MAQPTRNDVHVDAILSNISIGYKNAAYIAQQALPVVPVAKASDKYFIFDQAPNFRNEAGTRAPAGLGNEVGWTLSTDSYSTVQREAHTWLADEVIDNADAGLNLERSAVEFVTDKVQMKLEKDVAALVFGSANYASGHTSTPTLTWNDPDSTPIEDITKTAQGAIAAKIGNYGNTLILGAATYEDLRNHNDIMDRIKYSQKGVVTPELLATLFDVDRVLIGRAVENTAAEGVTASYVRIWGKHAALLYVPPSPGLRTLSYGYTFMWQGYNFVIERWYSADRKATGIRCLVQYDAQSTANTAGYLFTNAVA